MARHTMRRCASGFSIAELVAVLAVVVILLAMAMPLLGAARSGGMTMQSMNNLIVQHLAHVMYAGDYNGRQFVTAPEDLTQYADGPQGAAQFYESATGNPIPKIFLGHDNTGNWFFTQFADDFFRLYEPMAFEGLPAVDNTGHGLFRLDNLQAFHQYVNGRFFDPVFYAPNDPVPYKLASPLVDSPWGFPGQELADLYGSVVLLRSSYVRSPAALYNPEVMRHVADGGWQDPWDMPDGLAAPGYYTALHPSLKTHIIEHHWNQNAPADPCNPLLEPGSYLGCEPYYFNHSIDSAPVTLFYDGHVRLLPNMEAYLSDQIVREETGGVDGLWSRDTPMGEIGYFTDLGATPEFPINYHVLTTGGIHGRDTLGPQVPKSTRPTIRSSAR